MDDFEKRVEKLKKIRQRKDLKLRKTKYLKDTFLTFGGDERELKLRYYQVQGVLHLISVKRFILGDGTGLGKTLQSIAALCYLWEKNPDMKVLVLTWMLILMFLLRLVELLRLDFFQEDDFLKAFVA